MQNSILLVRRYKGFGGIEHQILTITSGLVRNGWRVYFLTDKESPFSDMMAKRGSCNVITSFGNSMHTARLIADICKRNNIQIIQSHMFNEDIRCRLAKLYLPQIKHFYRVHTYIDCSNISRVKKNWYHMIAKLTDFWVDGYLPINEMNRTELVKRTHVNGAKIQVIHDATRELDLSQGLFCPHNRRIAMIANFERGKGHDILVDGIRTLKDQGEQFYVKLIGGNPGQGTDNEDQTVFMETMNKISKYGIEDCINYLGYSSCIERDIKDCGMVVLPSDSEGTPNCLLEGIMLEKIVIATAVGGVPEFIIDGVTGFLHQPKSGQAFAETIMKVVNTSEKELEKMTETAKKNIINNYSSDVMVNQMINFYLSLL